MIILHFGIFKLSDIDQGIHQHPIQKKKEFSAFLKKKISEKKVKANFIASRTTLCTQNIKFCMQNFFFRKLFVCVRKSICGWKKKQKKIFGPNFQNNLKNFLCRIKKCQSYNFHIWELYDKHFFQKTKTSVFYHQIVLLESNSHRKEFIPVFNHF